MSAKKFFKSTSCKCIAVLLSILIVCGVLLTICNSLFYVSDQEKFERAIKKIYGKAVQTESVLKDTDKKAFDTSEINEAYKVLDDGNYLIKTTGKQGYGGNVVCWVVVKMNDNAVAGVGKVSIDSAPGESYLSKIDSSELDHFSTLKYEAGFEYELGKDGKDYIDAGASYTMRAISNAVNGAISYVNVNVLGGAVAADPFESFSFTENINKKRTTYTVDGALVKYEITTAPHGAADSFRLNVTVDGDGKISALTISKYGSTDDSYNDKVNQNVTKYNGKDAAFFKGIIGDDGKNDTNANYGANELVTGASNSNYLVLYACLFATANYQTALTAGGAQ